MINKQLLLLLALIFTLISCDSDDGDDDAIIAIDEEEEIFNLTGNQQIAIDYFNDITLGFEFGNASRITRKWVTDVTIFVSGSGSTELLAELDIILSDLNTLISESGSDISLRLVTNENEANYNIFFGTAEEYIQLRPDREDLIQSNFGLFFVNFGEQNSIASGEMYVDTERPSPLKQRHLLREELTQSLGLARDSSRFSDSIFQSSFDIGCAVSFAEIDEDLIQLLYDPRVNTGLTENMVTPVLSEIISDYVD